MNRRFSKTEIRNLRNELAKFDQQDAEKEQRRLWRNAEKREAESRAIREKRHKEYENLPWWSKLAGCWIDWCCTIRHPSEGPEVIGMFIANAILLSAVVCIPIWIFGATLQIFCSFLDCAWLEFITEK